MNRKSAIFLLIGLTFLADQWSKKLISSYMIPGDSRPVITNILHITYVKNTGAAFSILQDKTLVLTVVTAAALLVLSAYLLKTINQSPVLPSVALSMIIGGGLGNLVDRCRLGYVVDFIDFRIFPVFNIADISVTLGCFFLIIYLVLLEKRNHGQEINKN